MIKARRHRKKSNREHRLKMDQKTKLHAKIVAKRGMSNTM